MADNLQDHSKCINDKDSGNCDFDSDSTYFDEKECITCFDDEYDKNKKFKINNGIQESVTASIRDNKDAFRGAISLINDSSMYAYGGIQLQNEVFPSTSDLSKIKEKKNSKKEIEKFDLTKEMSWVQSMQTVYNNWIQGHEPVLERCDAEMILGSIKNERTKCLSQLIVFKNADNLKELEIYKLYEAICKLEKDFQNEIELCDMKYTEELEKLKEQLDFSSSSVVSSDIEGSTPGKTSIYSHSGYKNSSDSHLTSNTGIGPCISQQQNYSLSSAAASIDLNCSSSTDLKLKENCKLMNQISEDSDQFSFQESSVTKQKLLKHKIEYYSVDKKCLEEQKHNNEPLIYNTSKELNNISCTTKNIESIKSNYFYTKFNKCNENFVIPHSLSDIKSRIVIQSNDISENEFKLMNVHQIFYEMLNED